LGIYFEKIRRSVLRGRVLIYSQLIELNFLSRDFQVFGTLGRSTTHLNHSRKSQMEEKKDERR
tara:strand:- start:562 stop:750 length:189 start_codon:yes stop_codon:yes gene_type:complete